jgi:hypothetical protein
MQIDTDWMGLHTMGGASRAVICLPRSIARMARTRLFARALASPSRPVEPAEFDLPLIRRRIFVFRGVDARRGEQGDVLQLVALGRPRALVTGPAGAST